MSLEVIDLFLESFSYISIFIKHFTKDRYTSIKTIIIVKLYFSGNYSAYYFDK